MKGARGARGKRGLRGSTGQKGAKYHPTRAERTAATAELKNSIDDIYKQLDIQMRRIAQIQVQLDQMAKLNPSGA